MVQPSPEPSRPYLNLDIDWNNIEVFSNISEDGKWNLYNGIYNCCTSAVKNSHKYIYTIER